MEVPSASSFTSPSKSGYLQKLTGRGWIFSGSWKKRYCVLDGTKFYFYENEDSKGTEKSSGVISLDYYDLCEDMETKNKRNPCIFVIGTSVKGFFDNRHQFSTDSEEEMNSWIMSVHEAISEARQNRCRGGRHRKSLDRKSQARNSSGTYSQKNDDSAENVTLETADRLYNATKERARGPQGRRLPQRKSLFPPTNQEARSRSASLTSPERITEDEEEEDDEDERDTKWLSVSMEAVDRRDVIKESDRFTCSAEIVFSKSDEGDSQRKLSASQSPERRKKHYGMRSGQHAAISRELEKKWAAGISPRTSRHEPEIAYPKIRLGSEELDGESMNERTDRVERNLRRVEEEMAKVEKKFETGEEQREKRFTEIITEMQKLKEECQRALKDALEARDAHQLLVIECRALLLQLQEAEKK